ncbi:MAG: phosphoribosylformylglycinamidine cyclo-ligase [Actinomycetota bacterium]
MGETYESAGVSIAAGEEAVERIKEDVRSTFRPEVVGDIGGFGGLFRFDPRGYRDPVLVSTTDGVGTKALVAAAARRYDTIGLDLVAMCVDDLVCQGAEPLFFLDYISVGRLDPDQIKDIVAGVAEGCRQAGCALIGGEMAEHPGVMEPGEFDLVGFAVGVVDRDRILSADRVEIGDLLVALPSPGLRSNGYSLARRLLLDVAGRSLEDRAWDDPHAPTVSEELLRPSVIYAPAVRAMELNAEVHAVAHITGGGLPGNLNRALPDRADALIDPTSWAWPRVFSELQRIGDVSTDEMRRVFNLGVGMVAIVPERRAAKAIDELRSHGQRAWVLGEIVPGSGEVRFAE